MELKKSDPLYDVKSNFYRRDLTVPYRRIRVCVSDNENTKLLFAFLRIIEADNEDFDLLVSCSGNSLYRSIRDAQVAISIKNELKALSYLIKICDELLRKYPTTYEQDVERLARGNVALFSNERNALIQVKGEKEVLIFFKDLAATAINLMKSQNFEEFDYYLNEIRESKHTLVFQYCRFTVGRLFQDERRRGELKNRRSLDMTKPTVV